jgi:hypothetical protein
MEIGDKILGFKFKYSNFIYISGRMDKYIGEEGKIKFIHTDSISVEFGDGELWSYPKELAKNYLVDKEVKEPYYEIY